MRSRCATAWCNLDLTFDQGMKKNCLGYIFKTVRCKKLILRNWVRGVGAHHHCVTLVYDLT